MSQGKNRHIHCAVNLPKQQGALRAEIERLRDLKTPATRQLVNLTKAMLDDANAENERLRAALEDLIAAHKAVLSDAMSYDDTDQDSSVIAAREALENRREQNPINPTPNRT